MPATEELFRSEPYTRVCTATVVAASSEGLVLDRTLFYPEGGGQPGDIGYLEPATGERDLRIVDTVRTADGGILHLTEPFSARPEPGARVNAVLDWSRRHRHMRMHTCLHLLCALVRGARVTGGAVGADSGRLDFDQFDAALTREVLQHDLARLIDEDHAVSTRWISEEELAAQPELVRTLSVQPPKGQGRVRLIEIDGVDLQPCGGTHVARTGEIGRIEVVRIESKGRQNRRVRLRFAAA
jgi:misacylated tRNA(Ala) deacylase